MLNLLKLFRDSPFAPLKKHMEKVSECVEKISCLYEAFLKEDYDTVEKLALEISKIEHEADLIKNHVRNHMPMTLFLAVAKGDLLDILALQDSLADKAEDIAVLFTFKKSKIPEVFKEEFHLFLEKNLESFHKVKAIICELNELEATSFGGLEAEKVRKMVDEVAYLEHKADLIQRSLLKKLFNADSILCPSTFALWDRIFETVSEISNISENLANRIRMILELK